MLKSIPILLLSYFSIKTVAYSQGVAVNTDGSTPNASAMLDVKSANRGLLIPRMTMSERNAIPSPATGLLIFETDVAPGFYFYDGASWVNLSLAASVWNLAGNSGVSALNNFIGTTDFNPLIFRVNNLYAGQLHPSGNIFFGLKAGQSNTTGHSNVALGGGALFNNTARNNLVAIGDSAMYNNGSDLSLPYYGTSNTAVGSRAMFSNTIGHSNTALGTLALSKNVTGSDNTAIGSNALGLSIVGYENTAVGSDALTSNLYGTANTAIGTASMLTNYSGSHNTALGWKSLYANYDGVFNTAIGDSTLVNNGSGNFNTAVGWAALAGNSGSSNTAFGNRAMLSNTLGEFNTALGERAMFSNTYGRNNTAVGVTSLYSNLTGEYNTAVGLQALVNVTSGSNNTAVGNDALSSISTGSYNIGLGNNIGDCSASGNINNSITIGNYPSLCTLNSNYALFGSTSTVWTGGNTAWSTYSDGRIKINIKEDVVGLQFIMKLRPITYNRSLKSFYETIGSTDKMRDYPQKYDVEKIRMSGFVAQEVEQAANEVGYNFNGVTKPKSSGDLYSLSYSSFVVPLVKAVQEQQSLIDQQQKQINELLKRIEAIEKK